MANSPTSVTRLTPTGSGAIGVLALAGPTAWEIIRRVFRPVAGTLPEMPRAGQTWVGTVGEAEMADECVVVVDSLFPEPRTEVHCHGGEQVLTWLTELFLAEGASTSAATDITDAIEPLLAQAPTVRTATILLDQAQGAWEREMAALTAAWDRSDFTTVHDRLRRLENWVELGQHLVQPWRVVIAGVPNVGKSSLVNALAGFQRSIVADQAGTTRDVVSTRLALDGWPIELLDTAGWHDVAGQLEQAAIARARGVAASADLVLWVIDASQPKPAMPPTSWPRQVVVGNKCDLPLETASFADVLVSARTGAGVAELIHHIVRTLIPDEPPAGSAVPVVASHREAIRQWRERLNSI